MKYLDAVTLSWICILFCERIVPTNLYFPHLLYFKFMQKCMRKKMCVSLHTGPSYFRILKCK